MRRQKGLFFFKVIGMGALPSARNHSGVFKTILEYLILLKLQCLSKSETGVKFHSNGQGQVVLASSSWPFFLHFLQPSSDKRSMIICLLSPRQTVSSAGPADQQPQRFSKITSKPYIQDTGHFIRQTQIILQSKATREVSVYRKQFTHILINL